MGVFIVRAPFRIAKLEAFDDEVVKASVEIGEPNRSHEDLLKVELLPRITPISMTL